jgi:DNA-binding XRE family transcriptional regulator
MQKKQRRRLEQSGWAVGDAGEFLGLSEQESRFIETKLALASGLRQQREDLGLTQAELARRLGSSQSRVAKMEAADQSVSLDLLLRSLFRLGATRQEVARIMTHEPRSHAA